MVWCGHDYNIVAEDGEEMAPGKQEVRKATPRRILNTRLRRWDF